MSLLQSPLRSNRNWATICIMVYIKNRITHLCPRGLHAHLMRASCVSHVARFFLRHENDGHAALKAKYPWSTRAEAERKMGHTGFIKITECPLCQIFV